MSTTTAPAPGQVSAPAPTAENFDPSSLSSKDLAGVMRAADVIRSNPNAHAAPAANPAEEPAKPAPGAKPDAETGKEPTAEEKAAADKPVADEAAADKAAADAKAAEDAADDDDDRPLRIRVSTPEDKAIALIAKRQKVSFRQAGEIYTKGIEATKGPEPKTPEQSDPITAIDKQLVDAKTALDETRKALAKANADMDGDKVTELQEKLTDQKIALNNLDAQKRGVIESRENAAETKTAQAEHSDYQKVIERYPDLKPPAKGQKPSETREKFDAFVEEKMRTSDLFRQEGDELIPVTTAWRSILAREFAETHNLSPAAPKSETPPAVEKKVETQPPAVKPRQAPAATVLTTQDAPEAGSTFEATPQEVSRMIDEGKFTPKQLGLMMREAAKLKKAS